MKKKYVCTYIYIERERDDDDSSADKILTSRKMYEDISRLICFFCIAAAVKIEKTMSEVIPELLSNIDWNITKKTTKCVENGAQNELNI